MWETSLIIGISYLCITVAGFNLLQSPDEVVWGAEGKRFSLECKVDEAWQWCYWEITKSLDFEIYSILLGSIKI